MKYLFSVNNYGGTRDDEYTGGAFVEDMTVKMGATWKVRVLREEVMGADAGLMIVVVHKDEVVLEVSTYEVDE